MFTHDIQQIDFDTIKAVWSRHLWAGRKSVIEPVSTMKYLGGYDLTIRDTKPVFFGAFEGASLVGVNSGFATGDGLYRSRGIWVDPTHHTRGHARALIEAVVSEASKAGCTSVWTIPRQSAMGFYERCGFQRTSDWFVEGVEFGPNAYAIRALDK